MSGTRWKYKICKLQYSKKIQVFTLYLPKEFVLLKKWVQGDNIAVIQQKDSITLKKATDLSKLKGNYKLMILQFTEATKVFTITLPAKFIHEKGWKSQDDIKVTNYDDTLSLKKIEV